MSATTSQMQYLNDLIARDQQRTHNAYINHSADAAIHIATLNAVVAQFANVTSQDEASAVIDYLKYWGREELVVVEKALAFYRDGTQPRGKKVPSVAAVAAYIAAHRSAIDAAHSAFNME